MGSQLSFLRQFRFELERMAFWSVVAATRILPRRIMLASGRFFGSIAYLLDRRHRSVALKNAALAFPELSREKTDAIVRNCYHFFGAYLFDILSCFPAIRKNQMKNFEYEGLANLDEAYAKGKGAIFFTAHWGAWEQMGIAQGAKGYTLGLVARTLDNPYLDEALQQLRRSTGNFLIDKNNGVRPMLRALREGKGLAILIDQNVSGEDRIFVNFFGRAVATTPILGYLKLRTDAALIPSFALPLPNGSYRFMYGAPVEIPLSGDRKQDVWEITQACTRAIEEQIRRYPEFWLWMHNRWKIKGETQYEQRQEQELNEESNIH